MELVINIDNETYSAVQSLIALNTEKRNFKGIIGKCLNAVKNGVVLPKGHGRLIDADVFADKIKEVSLSHRYEYLKLNRMCTVADVLNALTDDLKGTALYGYELCPTVIEADKAYQKEDNNLPLCEEVIHGDFTELMDKE